MFFNGKKLTERKPRENRKVEFTDKFCRNYVMEDFKEGTVLTDALCKNLTMYVSQYGNHTYGFTSKKVSRNIGSVHTVTIKEAREIAHNIHANLEEFIKEAPSIKVPLAFYFKKYGMFPHKPQGTEFIISDENASLKNKIKDLQKEIEELQDRNIRLTSRLDTIRKLVCYDENDLEMAD